MPVNPSPFGPKPQFELASGQPAVGNQLFFYVAGSVNTKLNTYTDSTGAVANSNPLVLNATGEPSTEVWFTEGLAYKVVYAPAGDTDPPTSPIWTVDNLRGINDSSTVISQWMASGQVPTFVNTTTFTLPGDQTIDFQANRRLKFTVTAGTVYGTIFSSVFTTLTTIFVAMDTGQVLDSGLSAVELSILRASASALPTTMTAAGGLRVFYTNGQPTYQVAPGFLMDYAGGSVPSGWLQCDGTPISRTTFSELFTAIGTTWGAGDGVTTFNIPDFRRRTAVGSGGSGTGTLGNAVGNVGGAETHTLTTAELAVHSHGVTDPQHFHSGGSGGASAAGGGATAAGGNTGSASTGITINNAGSGDAHNNMQPSAVVLKLIKT
jgi:microcystin-dependent protein